MRLFTEVIDATVLLAIGVPKDTADMYFVVDGRKNESHPLNDEPFSNIEDKANYVSSTITIVPRWSIGQLFKIINECCSNISFKMEMLTKALSEEFPVAYAILGIRLMVQRGEMDFSKFKKDYVDNDEIK
jgi:hypothetical protein